MLSAIFRIFKPRTVDTILDQHNKTVRKLERHAAEQDEQAVKIETEIESMTAKRDDCLKESLRATRLVAKFKTLLD